ncbi:MAG TPA: hypothetical protein VJ779_22950 [Acetobacteraceae bacterium]|jgi:hypothetical protein|nr:hypothetical protein [Acetobacteraceae bacterium]
MVFVWDTLSPDLQLSLSREALSQARRLVGAQAAVLAEQMELGALPSLEGPDALRLLAMMLDDAVGCGEPSQRPPSASCS